MTASKQCKHLPPDASLLALARKVNARLPQGASVNFYRIEQPDSYSPHTGIVYQHGVRRANVVTQQMLTEHDADEILKGVNEWIDNIRPESRWTTDPGEAA